MCLIYNRSNEIQDTVCQYSINNPNFTRTSNFCCFKVKVSIQNALTFMLMLDKFLFKNAVIDKHKTEMTELHQSFQKHSQQPSAVEKRLKISINRYRPLIIFFSKKQMFCRETVVHAFGVA